MITRVLAAILIAFSLWGGATTSPAADPATRKRKPSMNPTSPLKPGEHLHCQLAGYLGIQTNKVAETYNAGYSMYVAAWPLVETYPGNRFQTGLFGTWMHQQFVTPPPVEERKLYCDIEGGLGWWRDTRFATETPKFIMGGVALGFSQWANGPGAGKNRDWDKPLGLYGVAQLSQHVLWPPDGLNLEQGVCGQLWGYGYVNLPLLQAKPTTAGKDVPTGGNCWTLFLNTGNFKGPVAFFTPYFFSSITAEQPELAGLFLDSLPGRPNRPIQMETQYIPCVQAADRKGDVYAKIEPTSFPRGDNGESVVLHQPVVYDDSALSHDVDQWLNHNGKPASGVLKPEGTAHHTVHGQNVASWAIHEDGVPREKRIRLDWKSLAKPTPIDEHTYGFHWTDELVEKTDTKDGRLTTLPQFYRLVHEGETSHWVAVAPDQVPAETGLASVTFAPKKREPLEPYTTPNDPKSCWKTPGPVAGPFKAKLGDGSTIVYSWYRFADQPAMLNADLTDAEREAIQKRVEKIHKEWTPDRDYLAPPKTGGALAKIDPALLVTPPKGFEIGYVPIVTWQGIER